MCVWLTQGHLLPQGQLSPYNTYLMTCWLKGISCLKDSSLHTIHTWWPADSRASLASRTALSIQYTPDDLLTQGHLLPQGQLSPYYTHLMTCWLKGISCLKDSSLHTIHTWWPADSRASRASRTALSILYTPDDLLTQGHLLPQGQLSPYNTHLMTCWLKGISCLKDSSLHTIHTWWPADSRASRASRTALSILYTPDDLLTQGHLLPQGQLSPYNTHLMTCWLKGISCLKDSSLHTIHTWWPADSRASLASRTALYTIHTWWPADSRASLASRTALSILYTPDDLLTQGRLLPQGQLSPYDTHLMTSWLKGISCLKDSSLHTIHTWWPADSRASLASRTALSILYTPDDQLTQRRLLPQGQLSPYNTHLMTSWLKGISCLKDSSLHTIHTWWPADSRASLASRTALSILYTPDDQLTQRRLLPQGQLSPYNTHLMTSWLKGISCLKDSSLHTIHTWWPADSRASLASRTALSMHGTARKTPLFKKKPILRRFLSSYTWKRFE